MLFLVSTVLYLLVTSECSQIVSKTPYCDQIGECKPGQHVMCMYYKPGSTMSSRCIGNPIDMTMENRLQILTKINKMRSATRYGNVAGKNNNMLPKGYGLKNLEWDDELATFAQVWANQCSLHKGDHCRATDRFPNPGQFTGAVQYAFPNLENFSASEVLRRSKDTVHKKATDLIESIINFVYDTKNYVTKNMVLKHEGSGRSNLFLLAVYGKTTHIGCAMSYWVSLDDEETNGGYGFYTIALVCNLSAQPVAGQKVYETNPDLSQTARSTNPVPIGHKDNKRRRVLPNVVSMPTKGTEKTQLMKKTRKVKPFSATDRHREIMKRPTIEIKERHFDRKPDVINQKHQKNEILRTTSGQLFFNKKPATTTHSSIFNKVPKFELPSQHNDNIKDILQNDLLSKNKLHSAQRLSREDFSRLKKLLSEFTNNKQSQTYRIFPPLKIITDKINSLTQTTDSVNSNDRSDDKLINFMYDLVQKANIDFEELVNITADIIHDGISTNPSYAWSKYNERYSEHKNDNHETISVVDDKLGENYPQILEIRKQNPLMHYGKNIITYNENNSNNINRNNEYFFTKNNVNVRDIRGTREENKYNYRKKYDKPAESDKHNDYYENVPGRGNLVRKSFNRYERVIEQT